VPAKTMRRGSCLPFEMLGFLVGLVGPRYWYWSDWLARGARSGQRRGRDTRR